ncbi:uncharacterized protein LOC120071285 [Benincasa hispida]|uniref:uncharacterized protein LOC120071285 n=1 Tax=Benincasa hispida TaxID=102211 RepID=UPI00190040F7|nr:uncharacterized protein LOC120071285 [Benincasa hispida]
MSSSSSDDDSPAAVEPTPAEEPAAEEKPTPAEETAIDETAAAEETTPTIAAAEAPVIKTSSRASGSGPVVRFDISQSSSLTTIAKTAIESLKSILPNIPSSLPSAPNPALALLNDLETTAQITALLRRPTSGAGDDNLCRWLYDTFQSNNPDLKLVVLRFLPVLLGAYLSRVVSRRKSLAGFEAVLLSLYAHETNRRASQPLSVNIPDLTHPSIYHESKSPLKNNATALNLAVISPSLEPHGMVRSTKRARIVGVALELYYTKIDKIPETSKIEFCEFCRIWASGGDDEKGKVKNEEAAAEEAEEESIGRIPLPWEMLQPILRVLGHCLLGSNVTAKCKKNETTPLFDAAIAAIRSLYLRSMHDINPKAILATGSLVRLGNMAMESADEIDYTEIPYQTVINL